MGISLIGSGKKFVAIFGKTKDVKKSDAAIVEEIVKHNPNVKSVLKVYSMTSGKHRMQRKKFVWGDKNTEVTHKEYGYSIRLDPLKVYFSPREAEIRQKIASKAKPKGTVMVMFAGVGPFALAIYKKQPKVSKIINIEWNKTACKYMSENFKLNKIPVAEVVNGDAAKVSRKFYGTCDLVIMPMVPAKNYIRSAVNSLKKTGTIIVYMITNENKMSKDADAEIEKTFKKLGVQYRIKSRNKISLYAPHKWKVAYEIRVNKK
jgi:tRNA (guanine37-N1)-methyltransferase